MIPAELSHLLLDLDGTLTDPKEGLVWSIQYALRQMGYPIPASESLEWCIGPPLHEFFPVLLSSTDAALVQQAITVFRERFSTVGKFENQVYPDVPEMLTRLRQLEYRVFLATTKPVIYARDILEHFDLLQYFDGLYGSELDGRFSDKGELIGLILGQEGIPPQCAMMIGDRDRDIEGARYNGVMAGGVTYGYGSVEELTNAGADVLFHSPVEIASFLTDMRQRKRDR
jgi:phosphoglycolate phosphatase